MAGMRIWQILMAFTLVICVASCATYQGKVEEARKDLTSGNPLAAAQKLEPLAFKEGKDQVVYLLDYATAMQVAGEYEKSNKALLLAEELTEIKDYHSLSKITASLLLNQEQVQYKGEDFEKVMINVMLALNFLMLDQHEAAMVEARKVNQKLQYYITEAKRDFEQNPLAYYLAAMIRENDGDVDGAYIDYSRVYDLNKSFSYIGEDLIRSAQKSRRTDKLKQWQKNFPEAAEEKKWAQKDMGEVVLIYQQGWGPRKRPHPNWRTLPKLYETFSQTSRAAIKIGSQDIFEKSQVLFSVEDVAMKTLNSQYDALVAKRVAAVAAKEVAADQVRQRNALLGDLMSIAMHVSDRADLRQWSTLSESFQVARVWLKKGSYDVVVEGLNSNGKETGESKAFSSVKVKPGKKTFLTWRSTR